MKGTLQMGGGLSGSMTAKQVLAGANTVQSLEGETDPRVGNVITLPTGLALTWMNDYLQVSFTDNTGGSSKHRIYANKDGEGYVRVATLDPGVATYNHYAYQNATYLYYVLALTDGMEGEATAAEAYDTPLVWKIDQSTLEQVYIHTFYVNDGYSVVIDWGDGEQDNLSGDTDDLTHDYALEQDPYYITLTGDLNQIVSLEYWNDYNSYGDLTQWQIPTGMGVFHFYKHNFTGDITDWNVSDLTVCAIFHIAGCQFTGDITDWNIPGSIYDFQIYNNLLTGDLSGWVWDDDLGHIELRGNAGLYGDISDWHLPTVGIQGGAIGLAGCGFEGDLSGWAFPPVLKTLQLSNPNYDTTNDFTGDLTGWVFGEDPVGAGSGFSVICNDYPFTGTLYNALIPEATGIAVEIDFSDTSISGMPGGHYKNVSVFNFQNAACNAAEIDRLLAAVDDYFTVGVVPLRSAAYTLGGVGNGIPSAAGLASKTSIESKYTAEGLTATIVINT